MKDYYAILGVPPDADPSTIREAWRRLAFEWHPDRNLHRAEEAHGRFLDLSEAWAVLRDARSRMEHDLGRPAGADPHHAGAAPAAGPSRDPGAPGEGGYYGFADDRGDPRAEERPGTSAHDGSPTLRQYRSAVRELARELAGSDRKGRRVDVTLLAATLLVGTGSLVVTALFMIGQEVPEIAPPFWSLAISWMGTLVLLAWFHSLRERRVELYRPFAEEVLQRTGHGWRGRRSAEAEAETP